LQEKGGAMMTLGKPEIVKSWAGKEQNVYRREVLYQEIWNFPITEVAKKYAVSDVMIHKVCREMDIPTPPVGYWAKKQAGKEVSVPPLPPSGCRCMKFRIRSRKLFLFGNDSPLLQDFIKVSARTIDALNNKEILSICFLSTFFVLLD
jgi:hypothetical protein